MRSLVPCSLLHHAVGDESANSVGSPMTKMVFDDQSLRLLKAYFRIPDKDAREVIVALAEAAASGAKLKARAANDLNEPKRPH